MDKRRVGRVNAEIQKVLAEAIASLKDPSLSSIISVTDVSISSDGSVVDVYVSILGTALEQKNSIGVLMRANGHLKRCIAKEVRLRQTPDIRLHLDRSMEYAAKIQTLLTEIQNKEDAKHDL